MNMFAKLKDINSALSKKFKLVINVFFIIMLNSFIFYPALGNAETTNITGIYIEGNQRIETQTILSISGLSIGERYSDTEINNALLLLNATKYFKLVKVNLDKQILTITVEENPTINSINFEGNFNLDTLVFFLDTLFFFCLFSFAIFFFAIVFFKTALVFLIIFFFGILIFFVIIF